MAFFEFFDFIWNSIASGVAGGAAYDALKNVLSDKFDLLHKYRKEENREKFDSVLSDIPDEIKNELNRLFIIHSQSVRTDNICVNGDVSIENQTINNFYQSPDYKTLSKDLDELKINIEETKQLVIKYPEDKLFQEKLERYKEKLREKRQELEDFKRDVLKLAEEFQRVEINTERLRLAYKYFQEGNYSGARAVLDIEELIQEQDDLLARKKSLEENLDKIDDSLKRNAEEWIIKARLSAIDYSLKENRIPEACKFFEKALKAKRMPWCLFQYAEFLADNHQFNLAKQFYMEALNECRLLVRDNRQLHLPKLAIILKSLAILLGKYQNKKEEAERYFKEALEISEELVINEVNDSKYIMIAILNHFANFLDESGQYLEAEKYYQKCLDAYKKLEINNPELISGILHDFAILIGKDLSRYSLAESYYRQSLQIKRSLVGNNNCSGFQDRLADTLNSLAKLLALKKSCESEVLYGECLDIYSALERKNPYKYQPKIAMVFNNLASFMADCGRYSEAQNYSCDALKIYRELNKIYPDIYSSSLATQLNNLGTIFEETNQNEDAEISYKEALDLYFDIEESIENKKYSFEVKEDIARTYTNLARLYAKIGANAEADNYYYNSLKQLRELVKVYPKIYLKQLRWSCRSLEQDFDRRFWSPETARLYQNCCEDNLKC